MKVKSKKTLKKSCETAWASIVRSKGYCEVCHAENIPLNAHHIIGRGCIILRYDFRNSCCLCVNCHEFSRDSVKNNPIKFLDWFKETRPEDYDYIKSKSNQIAHYTILDLQEILKNLKVIYDTLTS